MVAEDLKPARLPDRLRSTSRTFTEDRHLKRAAADHIERLEGLLREGLGHRHSDEYKALVGRALA